MPADAAVRAPVRLPPLPTSVFCSLGEPPSDDQLWRTLDLSAGLWETLVKDIRTQVRRSLVIWRYPEREHGWHLFLGRSDRLLLTMTPMEREFVVTASFPESAINLVLGKPLPTRLQMVLEKASARGGEQLLQFPIGSWDGLKAVRLLIGLKDRRNRT